MNVILNSGVEIAEENLESFGSRPASGEADPFQRPTPSIIFTLTNGVEVVQFRVRAGEARVARRPLNRGAGGVTVQTVDRAEARVMFRGLVAAGYRRWEDMR